MTDLARIPQTPRNLATVRPPVQPLVIEGMEGLTARDMELPRWTIVQGTSGMEGAGKHGGDFWHNVSQEFRESLEVVVLSIKNQRIMWPGDKDDHTPLCTSEDMVNGSRERDDQGRYGKCADCALNTNYDPSLWDKDAEGNHAPRCNYGYRLLVVDPETDDISMLGVFGLSVKGMKSWNAKVGLRGGPFRALSRFTTRKEGIAYVLVPSVKEWLNKDDQGLYREQYLNMRGMTFKDIEQGEDVEESDTDEVDDYADNMSGEIRDASEWGDNDLSQPPPPRPQTIVPKAPPIRTDAEPELSEANWYRNAMDLFNACTAAGIKIAANTRPRSDYGIPWFKDFIEFWNDELREHNARVHAAKK